MGQQNQEAAKAPTGQPQAQKNEAAQRLLKGMTALQLPMVVYPIGIESFSKDVETSDPELYYQLKTATRELIDAMKRALPEFEEALAKFK